jgi:hypothetical protein
VEDNENIDEEQVDEEIEKKLLSIESLYYRFDGKFCEKIYYEVDQKYKITLSNEEVLYIPKNGNIEVAMFTLNKLENKLTLTKFNTNDFFNPQNIVFQQEFKK